MTATREDTWAYYDRFSESYGRTYFRRFGEGVASSIGIGTYLGDPTDAVDRRYREALTLAVGSGANVLDTAVNYRCGRSERAVGEALAATEVDREAVHVATKGGFLPFEGARPDDPEGYLRERFVDPGIVDPDDLARGIHCLDPDYLSWSLDRSLDNLGLDAVDLYYVHNPETQLAARSREAVYDRLEAAFTELERRGAAGDIGAYGVATWDAFRVEPGHERYLSLPEVVSRARAASEAAGTGATGFRAIQLPFNVHMADAFTVESHEGPDGPRSALAFANGAGLSVFTSASLGQGDLAREGEIPDEVASRLSGDTPAQRALNFARSAPGVTCSLVGAASTEHVRENLAAGTFDPMGAAAFDTVFE